MIEKEIDHFSKVQRSHLLPQSVKSPCVRRRHHHPDPAAASLGVYIPHKTDRFYVTAAAENVPPLSLLASLPFQEHEIEKSPSPLYMDSFRVESKMRAKVILPLEEGDGAGQVRRLADAEGPPKQSAIIRQICIISPLPFSLPPSGANESSG